MAICNAPQISLWPTSHYLDYFCPFSRRVECPAAFILAQVYRFGVQARYAFYCLNSMVVMENHIFKTKGIFMKSLLSIIIVLSLFATPVMADEKVKEDIKKETPITKWIEAENSLLDSMPKPNRDIFFVFRNKHSVIRSIEIVRDDIGAAVKSCGTENRDMRKELNARFKQWQNAVLPILKEARKFLKQELKEQEAFHVSDYQHVMTLNDKAYAFSEEKIEKKPVSTKEACEGLLASMDASEDKLIQLLQTILLPEDVVRQRLEKSKKSD